MNIEELLENYELAGIKTQLRNSDDFKKGHKINITDVSGYNKLSNENKIIFEDSIIKLFNRFGLRARASIVPISIRIDTTKNEGTYMRFDYELYGEKEWVHMGKNSYEY